IVLNETGTQVPDRWYRSLSICTTAVRRRSEAIAEDTKGATEDDNRSGISGPPLDRLDPALRGAVRRGPRRVDRQRRPAEHRQGAPLLGGEPALGRQRLRDRLRRLPAARRPRG